MDSTGLYNEHMCNIPEWAVKHANHWRLAINTVYDENPHNPAALKGLLNDVFKCKGNPYWLALELVMTSDYKVSRGNKSPTLAVAIMRFFLHFIDNEGLAPAPRQIVLSAFSLTFMTVSNELFELVVTVYCLLDNVALCLPAIREALAQNYMPIENCARAIFELKVLEYFTVREFLFPLFAQSTTKRLYDLLNTSKDKQREFAIFLDSLLSDNVEYDLAASIVHFKAQQVGKVALNRGTLKTTVLRLVKKYKLSIDMCPNASRMQKNATLAYLLREIYVDCNVPKDDWVDMVCDFVGRDSHLQQQALKFMISAKQNDFATAIACAQIWKLSPAEVPYVLAAMLNRSRPGFSGNHLASKRVWPPTASGDVIVPEVQYYPLKLADTGILFVNDRAGFERYLAYANGAFGTNIQQVGIDCEWRPVFQPSKKARLALLQVASKFSVHIFDMIALKGVVLQSQWIRFVNIVFLHSTVVKMGFSLSNDLGMLCDFDEAFDLLRHDDANILDLSSICQKFFKEKVEVYPYYNPNVKYGRGLTDFVKLCFGFPLDKTEQKSDWEKRPLRNTQLRYAALDAFCLLEIYETLNKGCLMLGENFQEFCKIRKALEKPSRKKGKAKPRVEQPAQSICFF